MTLKGAPFSEATAEKIKTAWTGRLAKGMSLHHGNVMYMYVDKSVYANWGIRKTINNFKRRTATFFCMNCLRKVASFKVMND